MKRLQNTFLLLIMLTSFIACQNESQDFVDGEYFFREISSDKHNDDLMLQEFLLRVEGNKVSGKSIYWSQYGDPEFITLSSLTMTELDLKGEVQGAQLILKEKEAAWGADHSEGYELKFVDLGTWNWNGDFLTNGEIKMEKVVDISQLNSTLYRSLDSAKITH